MRSKIRILCVMLIGFIYGFGYPGNAFADEAQAPSEKKKFTWTGHKIRLNLGVFSIFNTTPRNGPMIQLGYEYGGMVSERFYLGIDSTWGAFFPDSFQSQVITLSSSSNTAVPSWALLLIPIIHTHFGYVTASNTKFTIGTAYFWGIHATVAHPISESFFVEAKFLWWLDRVLGRTGLHDTYFTAGAGIKF